MDESIGKLCNTVAKFCNHLQTSGAALKESVDRRPIPLDSASTTFVQSVNRRVSAAGSDLNMLESMSFATVSFEELLGHCNEVLKKNQHDILALQDHLHSKSNYIAPLDFDEEDILDDSALDDFSPGSGELESKSNCIAEEDPLLDDSLSLKNFGISDVCLATIASQSDSRLAMDEPDFQPYLKNFEMTEGETRDELDRYEDSKHLISVSRDDYENLPKHMKSLVSWEDLLSAVEKMNSCIGTKMKSPDIFRQDEIELLGLGFKARSYLLLLIKMNRLCVETNEGVISYRILSTCGNL
ncbi:hypothetical protein BUALT_Bualt09G0107100 [Buddleja alternifolia]|uniref:Spindle and kinetochore-associated protein 3 n=1 Tax=Buddleja alternifolia TaxID=168488 RepID=A0AAV6XCC6_9LAMI|nr:hypothetical protein BUALT_Bualt09G0107100 [Buddleja alternifolia]